MPEDIGTLEALDLTHVLCENPPLLCLAKPFSLVHLDNPASSTSLALALVTLTPILLMVWYIHAIVAHQPHIYTTPWGFQACYGALSIVTRDALILNMWLGQLACEGFNGILKNVFKEERPDGADLVSLLIELNRGPQLSRDFVVGKLGIGYGWPSSHSQFMVRISLLRPSGVSEQVVTGLLLIVLNIAHLFPTSVRVN